MFLLYCGLIALIVLRMESIAAVSECGVVSKEEWGGLKLEHVEYLPRPVELVIIMETRTRHCVPGNHITCEDIVQDLQSRQVMELNYTDIGYSFIIGGDLKVYEGAGWLHVGTHTEGYNGISIGIAFIGTFDNDIPSTRMMRVAKEFLKCGVKNGHLTPDYQVVARSQLTDLENPGINLYNDIITWPEWEKDVTYYNYKAKGSRNAR